MISATLAPVSAEKPLSGVSRLALGGAAGGVILLFYLFALGSTLLLLILMGGELVLLLGLARLGLAGFFAEAMNQHLAPLPIFLRSFWIRKNPEFHISLQPEDAPGLFSILGRLCQRVGVALPRAVSLEMNANAWVRLKGYRSGAGRTILGVGYDLLAGLAEAEVEAVLAHEMMHAKLVQRGLKWWLGGGLRRAAQLAYGLAIRAEAARRARRSTALTEGFLRRADWLARTCAQLVAAWTRQDEFAADRGAAQLCGAAAMRSALRRLERVGANAQRLPWRERVAQLQLGNGFGQWLTTELRGDGESPVPEEQRALFNKYSTHPSLQDRLSALPCAASELETQSPPGICLLAKPDEVAEKLMAEIQRVIAREEQKDTARLNRWSRKVRSHSPLRPLQMAGEILIGFGLVGGLFLWVRNGVSAELLLFAAISIGLGVWFYWVSGYRERMPLPVPDYAVLKTTAHTKPGESEPRAKELEKDLRQRMAESGTTRKQVRFLVSEAYSALADCDYLRAHVAACLCLTKDPESVEGMLAYAVAAAWFGQLQQVRQAWQFLQQETAFKGPSLSWGMAWVLMHCGDLAGAEAFLQQAGKGRAEEPTILALLAICQMRRGKLYSAISSARQACTPQARNKEYAKLLLDLLLDGGFLREAQEWLAKLEPHTGNDKDLQVSLVRLNLMRRNYETAEYLARSLESAGPHMLVRLGGIFGAARKGDRAISYYEQALAGGYYPEALLGLGFWEAERNNKVLARAHFRAALDVGRELGDGAVGSLALLPQILQHLLMLEEPVLGCRAWLATLNGGVGPAGLAGKSFRVYAPSQAEAERYLGSLLSAMQPGLPPVSSSAIGWREAPREQQPDGPVRPGIQGVLY